MQWPKNVLPGSLLNFETEARLKRYRLLAQAATRSGIRNLFLGHHQDDQIETILMRLVRGKSGSFASFGGIAAKAPIPAHTEVDSDLFSFQNPVSGAQLPRSTGKLKIQHLGAKDPESDLAYLNSIKSLDGRISIAQRLDISLHRPLLRFSKAQILATCKANNIPFVSDPTNFNPQITLRNAIRHLRANFKLPRALSAQAILKMHERASSRLRQVDVEVRRFLEVTQITSLDLRSGSLTLNLPGFPNVLEWKHLETPVSFLAQVLRLVSPIDDYEMSKSSQQSAARSIFAKVSLALHNSKWSVPATTLAVNQVLMTREDQDTRPDPPYYVRWRLSRQPFSCDQVRRMSRTFVYQPIPEHNTATEFWSSWIFWDCRYWIRICCASIHYLQTCTIRAFQSPDAAELHNLLDLGSREILQSLLHDAAPGKIRYTLPVIIDDVGVRALPTLDFAVPEHGSESMGREESKPRLLSWEVKYKYIDWKTIDGLVLHNSSTHQYRAAAEKYLKDQT
jgi:tRNA(Ile)-lysidine synthase